MSPRTSLPIRSRCVGLVAVILPAAVGLVGLPPRASTLLLVTIRLASAPLVPPRRLPRSRSRRQVAECPSRSQPRRSARPGGRFPALACRRFSVSRGTSGIPPKVFSETLDNCLLLNSLKNVTILIGDPSHGGQVKPRRGRMPAITLRRPRNPGTGIGGSASTSGVADSTASKRRVLPPFRLLRGLGGPTVRTNRPIHCSGIGNSRTQVAARVARVADVGDPVRTPRCIIIMVPLACPTLIALTSVPHSTMSKSRRYFSQLDLYGSSAIAGAQSSTVPIPNNDIIRINLSNRFHCVFPRRAHLGAEATHPAAHFRPVPVPIDPLAQPILQRCAIDPFQSFVT